MAEERYFLIELDTQVTNGICILDYVPIVVHEHQEPSAVVREYACCYYPDNGVYDEAVGVVRAVHESGEVVISWTYKEVTLAEYDVLAKFLPA